MYWLSFNYSIIYRVDERSSFKLDILNLVNDYSGEIILGLGGFSILLLIINLIAFSKIGKIRGKYDSFVSNVNIDNVEELLVNLGKDVEEIHGDINIIKSNVEAIETRLSFAIQKVGFVRYNAFAEMGSELSYSVALLDNYKNGFVLTSIYGRDYTASYAKPIKFGKSTYDLSVEEVQAIDRAIQGEYRPKTIK